jgi:hypothetical protein
MLASKLLCISKSASILYNYLNLQRVSNSHDMDYHVSADDFFPLFILAVIRANIPHLECNCEYISKYTMPAKLLSKIGYNFINLKGAMEFIKSCNDSSFSIDPIYYNNKMNSSSISVGLSSDLGNPDNVDAHHHFVVPEVTKKGKPVQLERTKFNLKREVEVESKVKSSKLYRKTKL